VADVHFLASYRRAAYYCRKHASATLSRFVTTEAASSERFCTSTAIGYERTTTNASDGPIHSYYDPTTGQFLNRY
jgi:hypothetical protein